MVDIASNSAHKGIFKCSACGYVSEVGNKYIGVRAKCPKCANLSTITKNDIVEISSARGLLKISCGCGFSSTKDGPEHFVGRSVPCPKCSKKVLVSFAERCSDNSEEKNKDYVQIFSKNIRSLSDSFERILHRNDYFNVFGVLAFLLSFKFVSLGCFGFYIYIVIITFLVWHQLNRFRLLFRRIWVDAILNESFFLTKILRKGTILKIISLFSSVIISFVTLGFIYEASSVYVVILVADVFFFVFVNKTFSVGLRRVFKSDISDLFSHFTSVAINVVFLAMCVFLTSYFSSHKHLAGVDFVDIPFYVKANVSHSCRLFQHYLRSVAYIDYNIIKLKDIPNVGEFIYSVFSLTHFSIVPFTCISFLYKCVARSGANNNVTVGEGRCQQS